MWFCSVIITRALKHPASITASAFARTRWQEGSGAAPSHPTGGRGRDYGPSMRNEQLIIHHVCYMCKHTSAASSPVSARCVLQRVFGKRGMGGGQVQVCKRTVQQCMPLRRGESQVNCCSPRAPSLPLPANHSLLLMCPPISAPNEGSTSSKSSLVLTLLLCAEFWALYKKYHLLMKN